MTTQALQQAIRLHQQGDIKRAQPLYLQVLRQQPEQPQALRNLGLIALQTGHIDDAADLYRRAIKVMPNVASWHSELAQVYTRAGDAQAGRGALQTAIRLEPTNSIYHYLLGNLFSDLGQMENAISAYRRSLELNPAQARTYSNLAHLAATGDYQFSAKERSDLERLINQKPNQQTGQTPLGDEARSHLHFAMASLLHIEKQYDQAFIHYQQANQLKKAATAHWQRFKADEQLDITRRLETVFTPEFIAARRDHGISSEVPVFIVGMPRTGTTLVERILAGHPRVVGRGELMHIKTIARDSIRLRVGEGEFPEYLEKVSAEDLRTLARQYIYRIVGSDQQAARIVDKMPTNYQFLGIIYMLFPKARIIHTVRDPMDTLWSCYSRNISARFSNDFTDLKAMYALYRRNMAFWQERLPMAIHTVRYENLVADFDAEARRLIDFLDLPWDDACLRYDQQRAQIATASKMQVRKPIYKTAVHAWKKYEKHLQTLRHELDEYY